MLYSMHVAMSCGFYITDTWTQHDTAICMPYGFHVGTIWFGYMKYIWGVGCKPRQYPHICHMGFRHRLRMTAIICRPHWLCTRISYGQTIAPTWMLYSMHMAMSRGFYMTGTWTPPHETAICMPYGFHMGVIWFSHMKYIWGVGCKPRQYPHVSHMGFTYRLRMTAIICRPRWFWTCISYGQSV